MALAALLVSFASMIVAAISVCITRRHSLATLAYQRLSRMERSEAIFSDGFVASYVEYLRRGYGYGVNKKKLAAELQRMGREELDTPSPVARECQTRVREYLTALIQPPEKTDEELQSYFLAAQAAISAYGEEIEVVRQVVYRTQPKPPRLKGEGAGG